MPRAGHSRGNVADSTQLVHPLPASNDDFQAAQHNVLKLGPSDRPACRLCAARVNRFVREGV